MFKISSLYLWIIIIYDKYFSQTELCGYNLVHVTLYHSIVGYYITPTLQYKQQILFIQEHLTFIDDLIQLVVLDLFCEAITWTTNVARKCTILCQMTRQTMPPIFKKMQSSNKHPRWGQIRAVSWLKSLTNWLGSQCRHAWWTIWNLKRAATRPGSAR